MNKLEKRKKRQYNKKWEKKARQDIHNYKMCKICGKPDFHHTKGLCYNCYKKQWRKTNNKKVCKECGKLKFHHAKGLCSNCYQKLYHPEMFELAKIIKVRKAHNIPYDLYKKITKRYVICGFDKIVDLHHLDSNHKNNSIENFVGLCPNHHKMIHTLRFKELILELIKKKVKPIIYEQKTAKK